MGETSWDRLRRSTLSVALIREIDHRAVEQYHMNSLVLMENAATACARRLCERFTGSRRVVILCGRGNNGGDGLAMARHLKVSGWDCNVILQGPEEKLSADTLANWRILTTQGLRDCILYVPAQENGFAAGRDTGSSQGIGSTRAIEGTIRERVDGAEVIVDAMLGSGAKGAPREPFVQWIQWANAAGGTRLAIDIPTGLDAETGTVSESTFQASCTLTLVARKPGFGTPAAQACLGEVDVLPIGIPVELIDQILAQSVSSGPGGGS